MLYEPQCLFLLYRMLYANSILYDRNIGIDSHRSKSLLLYVRRLYIFSLVFFLLNLFLVESLAGVMLIFDWIANIPLPGLYFIRCSFLCSQLFPCGERFFCSNIVCLMLNWCWSFHRLYWR